MKLGKHSSSIAYYDRSLYLAYYEGPHEGWDQQVVVKKKSYPGGEWKRVWTFKGGTGNPVLFTYKKSLYMTNTIFRPEMADVMHVGKLWANTDMEMRVLAVDGAEIHINGKPPYDIYPYIGCRCAPLIINDRCFLPCYDETLGHGVILEVIQQEAWKPHLIRKWVFTNEGPMIQPTLFPTLDGTIAMYCRNFAYPMHKGQKAIYGKYRKGYDVWDIGYGTIENYNNSILAIPRNNKDGGIERPWIVYNKDPERSKLVLKDSKNEEWKISSLDEYASYPNYCTTPDGIVHICFTAYGEKRFVNNNIKIVQLDGDCGIVQAEYV